MQILTFILSLAGALAWLPTVFEKIRKPKVDGKVLRYFCLEKGKYHNVIPFETNSAEDISGTIFLMRFRLISLYRNFHMYNISANVKFKSRTDVDKAEVYYCSQVTVNKEPVYLLQENSILMCPVLLKNETRDLDIQFIVKCACTDVEYIELVLSDYKNKIQKIKFKQADFYNAINQI